LSPDLPLLLLFAEHKVMTSDSTTQKIVVSVIFKSAPWVYLATLIQMNNASVFKGRQQEALKSTSVSMASLIRERKA